MLFPTISLAQGLVVGAAGGLRITGDVPTYGLTNSKRYLIGPKIEAGLPFRFGVEVDALYSRLGNTMYIPLIANEFTIRTIANSWLFPVLLKYHLPLTRARPFLATGVAPRYASGRIHTIHYGYYPGDVTFSSMQWSAHGVAWTLGGGVELHFGRIRLSPELRYLRWPNPSHPSASGITRYLSVPPNEVHVLLGLGWKMR